MIEEQEISAANKMRSLYMRSIHNASSLGEVLAEKAGESNNDGPYSVALLLYAMQRRGILPADYEVQQSVAVSDEMFKIIDEIKSGGFVCPEYDIQKAESDALAQESQRFLQGEQ